MHSQELLETQSIKTLNNYFNKLEKKKTKAAPQTEKETPAVQSDQGVFVSFS